MTRRNDQAIYERDGARWWDAGDRTFRSLQSVKRFHLALLDELCGPELAGATVVDLGCGGGLFALPLAQRGARVVGVDLSARSLGAARDEARRTGARAAFVRGDACRAPLAAGCARLVLISDVLEHLQDPAAAVHEAGRLLAPGGALFVNTFDRGFLSALLVVHLAEGLRLVPPGTHDPRLFVAPERLEELARAEGLALERLQRERPALWRTLATRTVNLRRARRGPGYTAFFRKVRAPPVVGSAAVG